MGNAAALDALRAQIRAIEGTAEVVRRRVGCGVAELEVLTGGLPEPGIVEFTGLPGSGRTRVALRIAAHHSRHGRAVAWVDPRGWLYPPAAASHGVMLERLLVVRPAETGQDAWAWAAEQLLRSGCFGLVVIDLPERRVLRRAITHGWARAIEQGGSTAIVLSEGSVRTLPAEVRLAFGADRMAVVRDRGGGRGEARLPPWPPEATPWGPFPPPGLAARPP